MTNKKLYNTYLILLVPLILFALYKNGIMLYQKDYVNTIEMFKPLILILIAGIASTLGVILKSYKEKKSDTLVITLALLEGLLTSLMLPLKTSPIVTFVICFLVEYLLYDTKYNKVVIMYLIIEFINYILGLNVFSNLYLENTALNYSGFDLFIGLGEGGIGSSNILILSICFIILSFNKLYKKDVVLGAFLSFLALAIIPYVITGEYEEILPFIFGYNIIYSFIFVLPCASSTPYTAKGQVLFGVIAGILTYFIYIIAPYSAAVLAIFLSSFIRGICDRIFIIK